METRDAGYRERVEALFRQAAFMVDLGAEPLGAGAGWAEAAMRVQPRHLQQDDVIHAGVQATLADHTAGAAAYTLVSGGQFVLTSAFTLHLLHAAVGERLRCRAEVLRAGRRLIVVESSVYAQAEGRERLVSKATVTLAVMEKKA